MKKTAVIGLGIIGGSICGALTRAGYVVDGFDLNDDNVQFALKAGYMQGKVTNISDYDQVILAVPPRATVAYLQNEAFKKGALVMDICGVKQAIEDVVYAKHREYRYVGLHPMAGKETSGIRSASPTLFDGANMIVTVCEQTLPDALEEAKRFSTDLGAARITECSADWHDRKIAITSQLAHIVSNAYVKSPEVDGCEGYTGGSFQDMTRIAGVDESMWTQLYMYNRERILSELDGLLEHLAEYRDAIAKEDERALSDTLKEGRLIRQRIRLAKDMQ